jgi:hypothetical protein
VCDGVRVQILQLVFKELRHKKVLLIICMSSYYFVVS